MQHEMPKPSEHHRKLAAFEGTFRGEEKLHPSPWGPGGAASARVTGRFEVDGLFLVQDYVEEKDGRAAFRGHSVFGWDDRQKTYAWYWFDSFGEPRRALLWRARDAHRTSPSFVRRALSLPTTQAPSLPPLDEQERTALDYRITGIPTGAQIMTFYREDLARRGVLRACDLADGRHGSFVTVAGAVVVKQHPETAKGYVFLSIEDETGMANIIIRPATYRKYKRVLDSDAAVVVGGALQIVDGVISVQAQRLDALTLFAKIAAREWQ